MARKTTDPSVKRALERVRQLCIALPQTTERQSHGAPTFFVRDQKTFVMFVDHHHQDGRVAIWCAAPPGVQEALVGIDSARFFRPPYVGVRGWLGLRLDVVVDWDQVAAIIEDAYRMVAPRRLVAELDAAGQRPTSAR